MRTGPRRFWAAATTSAEPCDQKNPRYRRGGLGIFRFILGLLPWAQLFFLGRSEARGQFEFLVLGKTQVHPTQIVAKYRNGVPVRPSAAHFEPLGLTVQAEFKLVPGLVVFSPQNEARGLGKMAVGPDMEEPGAALLARIQALEQSGLFEYVQPGYIYRAVLDPSDASFLDGSLWGLRNTGTSGGTRGADVSAADAWGITTGSTNVIVAVVDSGIRYTHRELSGQMWVNPGEIADNRLDDDADGYLDDVFGVNTLDGTGDPFDDHGHGTHVAGIIGAAANDGYPQVGVAWNVRLMACKFLGAEAFGATADAIACIDFAVQHGARVINTSWAGARFDRALFDSLAAARQKGVLVVAAAGNDFSDNDTDPTYPASYRLDNIISVAALDRHDRLSVFSNYGHSSVHLAAPGEDILSCLADSDWAYAVESGTSMAAPFVSGVAALLLAKFPDASVHELRERLLSTVVKVPGLAGKTITGGRVNAYRALLAAPDGILEVGFDPPEESDLSARRPIPFYVTVTDLASVTNATVRARIQGAPSEVVFHNDGLAPDAKSSDEAYSGELTIPTVPGPFQVTFTVTAPGKADFTRTVSYTVAVPPLNDNFADALEIPPGGALIQWTNRFATMEQGEPRHAQTPTAGASVWWNWTPSQSGPVVVDTTGSTFDTVLAIYTNSTLATLKTVAAADDSGAQKQAYISFNAQANVTYHIAVAGFSGTEVGSIRLRVEPGGGPDTTAPQISITSPATGITLTNALDAKLEITGTASDPPPNVSGLRQVQVQVNRDLASTAEGTTNWTSSVLLQEGQNRIKVVAIDYAGNISSNRSIVVTFKPIISPNDFLTNAFELTGAAGTTTGNNSRAIKEPGEPNHANNPGGRSIWWSYQPPVDGLLSLSSANSSFNTLLALYAAASLRMSDLSLLASNDDAFSGSGFSQLSQAVKAGQVYYIAVDGFNGATGTVQLTYSLSPATVYQLRVRASPGGSTSLGDGLFPSGAAVLITANPDPFYVFDCWEGSVPSTENPLQFTITSDINLTARFQPIEFLDGFESGSLSKLSWRSSGNSGWTIQTNTARAGRFAARSGAIANGQKTILSLSAVCRQGTGTFALRVSSEPTWDSLDFSLNGIRLSRWSGEVPWTEFRFPVPAGTNTFEWRYTKDFQNSAGLDAAWIDNLDLPLFIPADSSAPARLSIERFQSGALQLTAVGQTDQTYLIQLSFDLRSWTSVSTNTARGGLIRWINPAVGPGPNYFYRAIVP